LAHRNMCILFGLEGSQCHVFGELVRMLAFQRNSGTGWILRGKRRRHGYVTCGADRFEGHGESTPGCIFDLCASQPSCPKCNIFDLCASQPSCPKCNIKIPRVVVPEVSVLFRRLEGAHGRERLQAWLQSEDGLEWNKQRERFQDPDADDV
jgi:hypothetical protein